jgi:outer membrane lipoprotein-sorting protein
MYRLFFLFLVIVLSCFGNGEKESKDLYYKKIENFIGNLKTLKAEFIQEDIQDNQDFLIISKGKILIDKNFGVKISYENNAYPSVIVNQDIITIYDHKTKNYESYNASDSPAFFIIKKGFSIAKDIKVISYEQNEDFVNLKFASPHDYTNSIITLNFCLKPFFMLAGWVVENNGRKTNISFIKDTVVIGDKIDPSNFDQNNLGKIDD